jgi:predicted enzyme involved in methoxymalonyl-ACP biosynthesis
MILRGNPKDQETLEVDTWVMSCRVFGRQLEDETMNIAVEQARAWGARRIVACYVPTSKNVVVSELYPQLGFLHSQRTAGLPGASRWEIELASYVPRATQISRRST